MQVLPEISVGRSAGAGLAPAAPPVRRSSKIMASLYPDDVSESTSRRSSINFAVPEALSRRGSNRPGPRQTLGGLGRRLSMMRKLSKPSPRTEPLEETIELPQAPRFISQLSPEAQYAAMKCYEDILFDRILETSPEYSNVFERTPSPPQNLQMLCIKDKASDNGATDDNHSDKGDDGYGSDTDSDKSKPVYVPISALKHKSVSEIIKPRLPPLSRDKKLLMSYRFQCAFDILDALKLKEGQIVTSGRVQSAYFDPVRNFATWHHNWSKEFKIVNKRVPNSARV